MSRLLLACILLFGCMCVESSRIYRFRRDHHRHGEAFSSMSFIEELSEFKNEVILQDQVDEDNFEDASPEDKFQSFTVLAPNITIPEKGTTYWCSTHKLPDFADTVHGVGFGSSISGRSKGLIPHMLVLGCDINDGEIPYYNGECSISPQKLSRCGHVLGAWASGAKTFLYPEEAGKTFFSSTKSQYVRLEIHYNNPDHLKDIVDMSGIRFFYANQRRQFEVGITETGNIFTPDMVVPPRQKVFSWPGVCPSECTEKALPPGGITIFGSQLHAHLAGRRLYTSHSRGFVELPEIDRDDHYSTWNEIIHPLVPTIKVLPGDQITIACEFNTENRDNLTYSGMGMNGEMCVTYLYYYPASNLEICKSSVSKSSVKDFLAMQNTLQSPTAPVKRYSDIQWDSSAVDRLDILYQYAPLQIRCLKSNGKSWKGNWDQVSRFNFEDYSQDWITYNIAMNV